MTVRNMATMQDAYRNLTVSRVYGAQSVSRISSGLRVNSAADDAAGLSISEGMRAQVRGLDKAYENTQNAVSLIQTADSGLSSAGDIMNRMRELAVQSSNGAYSDDDRAQLSKEFNSLKSELNRISDSSSFNGRNLLDGTLGGAQGAQGLSEMGVADITASGNLSGQVKFTVSEQDGAYSVTARMGDESVTLELAGDERELSFDFGAGSVSLELSEGVGGLSEGVVSGVEVQGSSVDIGRAVSADNESGLSFQVGPDAGRQISMRLGDMSAQGLGLDDLDIGAVDGANAAIELLNGAIDQNSDIRGTLGAMQNRLAQSASNLAATREGLTSSESSLRDLDMAKELISNTSRNIMMQASQSMMAQGMNLARNNMMAFLLG